MLFRIVLLFIAAGALLFAEINSMVKADERTLNMHNEVDTNTTALQKQHSNAKDINSTLDLLEGYNSVTAAGVLQSERDTNITKKDNNSSKLISATTKLDDVTNLDIMKAQRKQRKIERKEADEKLGQDEHPVVDTIVVKGSILQGRIDQLTSQYISFKLIYGEGSIRIKYSDVEALQTEHEYHIYFDGKETEGYISGIQDSTFLKIQHGKVEELVTISKIDRFIVSEKEDPSLENKIRNTFPYWSGNLDVGIEYESGSTIKNKLKVAGHVERSQSEYKTIYDVLYAYEETRTIDTDKVLNKHELYTFLEQHYAMTESDFIFGEVGYDFDVPRGVDHRLYPAAGYGYLIKADKNRWIQFKIGVGFVYEIFIDDPVFNIPQESLENRYAAGAFGIDGEYEIRDIMILNRVLFGATLFYMPGMEDLKSNWLLRYSVTTTIPLSKALALKIVTRQVTDDNPSPDVGNNKLTFDLYLSLRF